MSLGQSISVTINLRIIYCSLLEYCKKVMTKKRRSLTILLLGLLTTIVPFSIDMYLPGFPDIAESMNVTSAKVALSLSSFFVGIGLGQLLYGPLLDRFGRKKPLYAGLLLYFICSVGCAYAVSIETLILLRFIQAIGACSASIAATAMVRDLFPPEENAKIFSILILVLSVSPMLAPTIGSYLSEAFGWQSIFILLTILGVLICLGVFFFLPESKSSDKNFSLKPPAIIKNYLLVIKEPYFIFYAFIGALGFASLFIYIAGSPTVFMEHFSLTQKQYGLVFAVLASGLILASQINTVLLKKFKSESIIVTSVAFQNGIGVLLLLLSFLELNNFWLIVSLLFFYLSTIGMVMPNATALAMKPFEKNAGSASSLLGFIQMGLGALATIAIGILNIKTVLPMATSMVACSLLNLGLAAWSIKFFQRKKIMEAAAITKEHTSLNRF